MPIGDEWTSTKKSHLEKKMIRFSFNRSKNTRTIMSQKVGKVQVEYFINESQFT